MPITPLSLTTRSGAGAALTVTQHDDNLTAIQTAVNALITQVAAQHNDDGTIKDGTVSSAAKISDAIITLAKMAALGASDRGKWIRANGSTGAIEAAAIYRGLDAETNAINSAGATAGLALGSYSFANVPAGDVLVWARVHIKRNAGANGGTVWIEEATAGEIDGTNTHCIDAGGTTWFQLNLFGKIASFAGGTLTLDMFFETSEGTSDVTFGVAGDARFGRRVMILAGL